jgi:predicted HTH domain antitoxin
MTIGQLDEKGTVSVSARPSQIAIERFFSTLISFFHTNRTARISVMQIEYFIYALRRRITLPLLAIITHYLRGT